MIEIFHDPDQGDVGGYRYWLEHNPQGYVLDRHREGAPRSRVGGKFHRVSCTLYIWPPRILDGALGDHRFKACSNDRDALLRWAQYVYPNAPDESEMCTACNPFNP